jgi:protein Tex
MCSEIISVVVSELKISRRQIIAVKSLLDEGNTVPFIARYRKEQHNNLDEVQIIEIKDKLEYYSELEERKKTIIKVIDEQGKLNSALKKKIESCTSKTLLEDIYLPYRPKRRSRAMIAREKGLQELADIIMEQDDKNPEEEAVKFIDVDKKLKSVEDVLKGAVDIVAEAVAENAEVRKVARNYIYGNGILESRVHDNVTEPTKYEQYYEYDEKITSIPSHRFLAIKRGQSEGILKVHLRCDSGIIIEKLEKIFNLNERCAAAATLKHAIKESYRRLLFPSLEIDVMVECKLSSDRGAINIFAINLRNLLMQPPLGRKVVLAVDPGLRTGCKCAVIDATGKFLETKTIYLLKGERSQIEAKVDICKMIAKYRPAAIAVGNGTGGRETEHFIKKVFKEANIKDTLVVSVNEAGASVYSASEIAREEFGDIDLTVRGAISIGRRLQDPLAELVKIDPKAIGVGQYQHDVNQNLLAEKLNEVVVSCVNHVGVELNTASAPLLAHVSGIGSVLAKKIVEYRDANGAFKSRNDISKVPGLGPKTFEQAAGFLRIHGAPYPLDNSAVHPERYKLVEKMAADLNADLKEIVGNKDMVEKIALIKYVSDSVGELTLKDIVNELKKPGRDPRDKFEKPAFRDDVLELEDVKEGMILEGIVTNVTAFGAFVDIGVHQDGLVHVSELANRYVKDPAEIVKTGDKIKVTVLSVDLKRRRISLSAKHGKSPANNKKLQNREKRFSRSNSGNKNRERIPKKGGYKSGFTANPFADL